MSDDFEQRYTEKQRREIWSEFLSSVWKLIKSALRISSIIAGYYYLYNSSLDPNTKLAIYFLYAAQFSVLSIKD